MPVAPSKAPEPGDALPEPGSDEATVGGPAPSLTSFSVPSENPGERPGRYKLLEQIRQGGMGTVWMTEQTEPVSRRVALKVIHPGTDSRQILALMNHPNVANGLDIGSTSGGRPFFVMELVRGRTLTRSCDEQRLSIVERLELFTPVCQAIQRAHQKGIIHRDIKPGNILDGLRNGHGDGAVRGVDDRIIVWPRKCSPCPVGRGSPIPAAAGPSHRCSLAWSKEHLNRQHPESQECGCSGCQRLRSARWSEGG